MCIREYKIYCFVDGDDIPYYIGQTYDLVMRMRVHKQFINDFDEVRSPSKYPYYRKARKLIKNGIKFSFRLLEDNLTKEEADIKEFEYIKEYRIKYKLLNILDGGNSGQRGKFVSEETKKKISESKIGKPLSEEHKETLRTCKRTKRQWTDDQKTEMKQKVSEHNKGKTRSQEEKERLKTMNIGRKHSDEVNMSKGRSGENHPRAKKYKLTNNMGIEYIVYGFNKKFCNEHNLTQSGLFLAFKEKRRYKGWQIELLN